MVTISKTHEYLLLCFKFNRFLSFIEGRNKIILFYQSFFSSYHFLPYYVLYYFFFIHEKSCRLRLTIECEDITMVVLSDRFSLLFFYYFELSLTQNSAHSNLKKEKKNNHAILLIVVPWLYLHSQ